MSTKKKKKTEAVEKTSKEQLAPEEGVESSDVILEESVEESVEEDIVESESADSVEEEKKESFGEKIAKKMGVKDFGKKKVEKLESDIVEKDARIAELERSVANLVAENRNQKGRLQKESELRIKYALEGFFKELILIKDDFDKALTYFHEDQVSEENRPLFDGIKHVNVNLEKAMEKSGLKGYNSIGEMFDPSLHQAMRVVDYEEKPKNEIVNEYFKGYKFHDRILRPAMVEVASGNSPEMQKEESEEKKDEK